MHLPRLDQPQRFRGLYVFDFGEWSAVGYTAEEIAILLESEQYRAGKVYRIHNVWPDGRMELRGIAPTRFAAESGLFFHRTSLDAARRDFDDLIALAEKTPAPSRAFVHLAQRAAVGDEPAGFVTALIYPAEYDDEFAAWLLAARYEGGDLAEGGISHVTNYYGEAKRILDRRQLWSPSSTSSRSADEVLASVRRAVQR